MAGPTYSRVEQDDHENGANGHYPPSRVQRKRGCMNRSISVGLVTLGIVIAIGVLSSWTGPNRPWNDPPSKQSSGSAPPAKVEDVLDTGAGHPSKGSGSTFTKLMSHADWQALEDEKFNPKNFVLGPPTKKYRGSSQATTRLRRLLLMHLSYRQSAQGHQVHVWMDCGRLECASILCMRVAPMLNEALPLQPTIS